MICDRYVTHLLHDKRNEYCDENSLQRVEKSESVSCSAEADTKVFRQLHHEEP